MELKTEIAIRGAHRSLTTRRVAATIHPADRADRVGQLVRPRHVPRLLMQHTRAAPRAPKPPATPATARSMAAVSASEPLGAFHPSTARAPSTSAARVA